jgi:hypothetical protein
VGIVIEDAAHDLLRDIPVDQPGPERVPPLVRSETDGLPMLVTDVAAFQPAAEGQPVAAPVDPSMGTSASRFILWLR